MRIREIQDLLYDGQTATLRVTGLNPFKKNKSVRISIDDPEKFLNAMKIALSSGEGKLISLDDEGRIITTNK